MLKLKIKDYSRKGVVLFFCVLLTGLILRLSALKQSATDFELSQLYFSRHLDQVFFLDSQTPLYYLFSVIPDSVSSLRVMMILLSLGIAGFCSYLIMQNRSMLQGLMFFTAWWLWPVNLISFDLLPTVCLLVLVLWNLKPTMKPLSWWMLLSFLQLFHPLILVLLWGLTVSDFFRKKINASELRFIFSTSLAGLIYLGAKLGTFGLENAKVDLPSMHFFLFLLPLCYLIFQKREASLQQLYGLILVFFLYDSFALKPWITYPGDDEAVAAFKSYTAELYERPLVICATISQQDYYFKFRQNCQNEVLKHQLAKSDFTILISLLLVQIY